MLAWPLPREAWQAETLPVASADGSFIRGAAGWGVVLVDPDTGVVVQQCGPVVLTSGPLFIGAVVASNNTGELTAMYMALKLIHDTWGVDARVVLEYDSEYAAGVARGLLRPRCNLALAMHVKRAAQRVAGITWRKARAHTGLALNDRADRLARCGAAGMMTGAVLQTQLAD